MDAQSKVLCMVLMAASGRWLNENNSGLSDLTSMLALLSPNNRGT